MGKHHKKMLQSADTAPVSPIYGYVRCRLGPWWRWSFGIKSWMRKRWQKPPTIWWPNWLLEYRRRTRSSSFHPLKMCICQKTPLQCRFFNFYWDADLNFDSLLLLRRDESWRWKHLDDPWHGKPGGSSTPKPVFCFNWVMFVSWKNSWSKGSLWFHLRRYESIPIYISCNWRISKLVYVVCYEHFFPHFFWCKTWAIFPFWYLFCHTWKTGIFGTQRAAPGSLREDYKITKPDGNCNGHRVQVQLQVSATGWRHNADGGDPNETWSTPRKSNIAGWKMNPDWRCISY